ncbi:MAG: 7-cyano-7-deazaguanine synthase QueC [Verrucomicrobiota bacterium]
MKIVALLSGGMDSVVALYDANQNHDIVAALSFDYGSKHNHREIEFAKWHCEKLGIYHQQVDLPFIRDHFQSHLLQGGGEIPEGHYAEETMKQTVVPFRNGIMLSIACGYAESQEANGLLIAAHAGDHAIYPDCREEFMKATADSMKLGTYQNVELMRPFVHMTKAEICSLGHELKVDFLKTWSCYVGGEVHCGACGTCIERREAFLLAGIPDPTVYESTPEIPQAPVGK